MWKQVMWEVVLRIEREKYYAPKVVTPRGKGVSARNKDNDEED